MTRAKVILVDDDKSRLAPFKDILQDGGLEVVAIAGGFDGLERLGSEGADLLIAATALPDIDGYHLSCLVKCNEKTQSLPVILIKTNDDAPGLFWVGASFSDSVMSLDDPGLSEEILDTARSLIEQSKKGGWKPSMARDNSAMPERLSSSEVVDSFRTTLDSLLISRVVGFFTRSLASISGPRRRFLDCFFAFAAKLFGCQACGIMLSAAAKPWASFQVADGTSKKAFDQLIKKLSAEIKGTKELALDIQGTLQEDGGEALNTPEILTVRAGKYTLGMLVFCSANKDGFDRQARAALAELKIQIAPVFGLLKASQEAEELQNKEQFRASTDPLTGLYNLEFLVGFLQQQLLFSYRQRSPVGLILIDIDQLQSINDKFGYEVGDLVLSSLANRLHDLTRASDLLARYGGDELIVVLPNTDLNGAKTVAGKIRQDAEEMSFVKGSKKGPHVTVSIGCACFNMTDLNPETVLRDAKMALARAKAMGANSVSI